MLKCASAVAALMFAGSAYAAAPTTYVAPTAVPLQLESPVRALTTRPYIVCNEGQARSYLRFMQVSSSGGSHAEQLRALKGSGPATDGRLCDIRMLSRVQLGNVVYRQAVGGRDWHVISASRRDYNGKVYHFKVVGGADK